MRLRNRRRQGERTEDAQPVTRVWSHSTSNAVLDEKLEKLAVFSGLFALNGRILPSESEMFKLFCALEGFICAIEKPVSAQIGFISAQISFTCAMESFISTQISFIWAMESFISAMESGNGYRMPFEPGRPSHSRRGFSPVTVKCALGMETV